MTQIGANEVVLEPDDELVVIRDDIKIIFNRNGEMQIFGDVPVTRFPKIPDLPANRHNEIVASFLAPSHAENVRQRIGEKIYNGTIFAGVSPETNKPIYARPHDEPLHVKWEQARDYANGVVAHEQPAGAFRLPTEAESFVMYAHRNKIGGFNESGLYPFCWYWTSKEIDRAQAQFMRFSDGYHGSLSKDDNAAIRLICD